MKKTMKSRIFLVIITTIIVTGVSVYAANIYKASDVVYNVSDGTSMSVEDALNNLYDKSKNAISYNEIIINLDGLAYGIEYYIKQNSSSAKSGSVISIKKDGATISNTSSYGSVIYAVGLGRYHVKTNGLIINEIYAKKVLSNNNNESFSFNKISLNLTLTATLIDTYTSKGSVSQSVSGNVTIYPDGTYTKDGFSNDFSTAYGDSIYEDGNSSLARYQTKAVITINSCEIS